MAEYIACRSCDSPDCKGCNLKRLETMLENGKFECLMNENRCINTSADVEPVQEWISVNDRLPDDEQEVLVIAHGWDGRLVYVGSHKRVEAQKSWLTGITNKSSEWSLWGWSYLKEPMVTHWMPLPSTEGLK